ncbi:uncharacterized protein LOC141607349 isoform X2 [Silene latifolia]|uniref:uncharacterized protein LOC141607349 isoform X2 n=1 Tax=Silene latifolia TaxID=37657 RepID=UPI003D778710
MSTRVSRRIPLGSVGPSSQQKKGVLEFDLNETPSDHSHFNEGDAFTRTPTVPEAQGRQQRSQLPPVTIDVDTSDDDVVLSSPRAFEEARNNLRRHQNRSNVVDVDSEPEVSEAANNRNKRQRVPANVPVINCESYVARDRNKNIVNGYGRNMAVQTRRSVAPPPPPPPPPPPEPAFSCPICMGPFVEEISTKCGHIFCKECLTKALKVKSICPTCRTKVTLKGTIRVFLPKTS